MLRPPRSLVRQPTALAQFRSVVGRRPTPRETADCKSIAATNGKIYAAWRAGARRPRPGAARPWEVPVLVPFRDNGRYIRSGALRRVLLAVIEGLQMHKLRPSFWFYENNSEDGTPTLLRRTRDWLSEMGYEATLIAESLPESSKPVGGRSSARCRRIATCRNGLIGQALPRLQLARYALWMDTNVLFGAQAVASLGGALHANPKLGVATAATVMGYGPQRGQHYYDTYAYKPLKPQSRRRPWAFHACPSQLCTMPRCRKAQQLRECDRLRPGGSNVVPVASAFGGLAMMRTEALLQAHWSSAHNLCEHVAFCAGVRAAGYTVAIVEAAVAQWLRD